MDGNFLEGKEIVLASSSEELKKILSLVLRSYKCSVQLFSRADELLSDIRSNHPDLALIDFDLEDTKGLDVCKELKGNLFTAYIPTIALIEKKHLRKNLLKIEQGIDDYLIKPPDPIDLKIRMELAFKRSNYQFFSNSLTRLPGSKAVEGIAQDKLSKGKKFCLMHIDIDNFKSFNDKYGYVKGNLVIKNTAYILFRAVNEIAPDSFIGHIGGDDFALISSSGKAEELASYITKEFDRLIRFHYNSEHRNQGFIRIPTREGGEINIPLMTISCAVVDTARVKVENIMQFSSRLSEIKSFLKGLPGSNFLIDRRESNRGPKKRSVKQKGRSPQDKKEKREVIKPLGQILMEKGMINEDKLYSALEDHWDTSVRLGEVLKNLGWIKQEDIDKILEQQKKKEPDTILNI